MKPYPSGDSYQADSSLAASNSDVIFRPPLIHTLSEAVLIVLIAISLQLLLSHMSPLVAPILVGLAAILIITLRSRKLSFSKNGISQRSWYRTWFISWQDIKGWEIVDMEIPDSSEWAETNSFVRTIALVKSDSAEPLYIDPYFLTGNRIELIADLLEECGLENIGADDSQEIWLQSAVNA